MLGKEIAFVVAGKTVKGIVTDITDDMYILTSGGENQTFRISIPKNNVSYMIEEVSQFDVEIEEKLPVKSEEVVEMNAFSSLNRVIVLACQWDEECTGVKYLRSGIRKEDIAQEHFNDFIVDCPRRCDECKFGIMGYLDELSQGRVEEIIDHLLIGEYPKRRGRPRKENDE